MLSDGMSATFKQISTAAGQNHWLEGLSGARILVALIFYEYLPIDRYVDRD